MSGQDATQRAKPEAVDLSKQEAAKGLNHEAVDFVDHNVSFDFKAFLKEVGPAPSFDEPLGPSAQCLSIDQIRSYHSDGLEQWARDHVLSCDSCSELIRTYALSTPEAMPQDLFERISHRLKRSSRIDGNAVRRSVWMSLPPVLRWTAAPALAVVLVWACYPAIPYLPRVSSRFEDAWVAFHTGNRDQGTAQLHLSGSRWLQATPVPNDPQKMRLVLDDLILESNRGEAPLPHQVDLMIASVAKRSAVAASGDSNARLWRNYVTELAALGALSQYEALRKESTSNVPSVGQLKIEGVADIDGVPAIMLESDQVQNARVGALLGRSARESGIPRLYVYKNGNLVYDFRSPPTTERATVPPGDR